MPDTRAMLSGTGGVLAAFLGSLCCAGPVVFAAVGVSAGVASRIEPLRPLFGVLMVVAFAVGFRRAYGQAPSTMSKESSFERVERAANEAHTDMVVTCLVPTNRRRERLVLWSAASLALVLWTYPTWPRLLR